MKYYVVGIDSRASLGGRKVCGEALVYAPDKYKALSMVREAGWVPNPGGIWILGGKYYDRWLSGDFASAEIELAKDKAREEGVAILWTSKE